MATYIESTQYNGVILHKSDDYPKTRFGFDDDYSPPRKYIYYYDNHGTVYKVYGVTTRQIDKDAEFWGLQCIGRNAPDYFINRHGEKLDVRVNILQR